MAHCGSSEVLIVGGVACKSTIHSFCLSHCCRANSSLSVCLSVTLTHHHVKMANMS